MVKKVQRKIGPVTSLLIGLAGTIVSVIVTIQLRKMLAERGLSDRAGDLKAALKGVSESAGGFKRSTADWVATQAEAAAKKARDLAETAKE